MVEHERLFGKQAHQVDRCRHLMWIDQKVVREPEPVERPHAPHEGLPEHKPRIRLILHDVPHAYEFFVISQDRQVVRDMFAPQIHPAHDAADERMLVGQAEQPAGLRERLTRLHGHAPHDAHRPCDGLEVGRQMVAGQPLHPRADPRVFGDGIVPKMLVGVDSHGIKGRATAALVVLRQALHVPDVLHSRKDRLHVTEEFLVERLGRPLGPGPDVHGVCAPRDRRRDPRIGDCKL